MNVSICGILRRRMLAFGSLADLSSSQVRLEVELAAGAEGIAPALRMLPFVLECSVVGRTLHLLLADLRNDTPEVVRAIVAQDGLILSVHPARAALEEIYLRAVREGPA